MSEQSDKVDAAEARIKETQADREAFDLDSWKQREPFERQITEYTVHAEKQQVVRRGIETLAVAAKNLGSVHPDGLDKTKCKETVGLIFDKIKELVAQVKMEP